MRNSVNIRKFLLFLAVLNFFLFVIPDLVAAQAKGNNCEENSLKLDGVRNYFSDKLAPQVIILIARLGEREKSVQLNRRRLYTVKEYLIAMGVKRNRIITTSDDVKSSNGTVEIYIEGQLFDSITIAKNADIPIGSCDYDREDQRKYQLPKVRYKSRN